MTTNTQLNDGVGLKREGGVFFIILRATMSLKSNPTIFEKHGM